MTTTTRSLASRPSRLTLALCVALYGALALVAYVPVWPGDANHLPWCACADPAQVAWFLRWTPYALAHGHNPFYSNYLDYPSGVNLAQNTLMPLLGLLMAPVTLAFGPVASLTLLLWLGISSSATAAFFVFRRWAPWTPAAFIGGLLYGFSPYIAGQALGHLDLSFVPIPPLLLLVLDELLVRQRMRARRVGVLLGLLGAVQFLISPEVLVDCAVMTVIGVVLLVVFRWRQVAARVQYVVRGVAWAVPVGAVVVGFPVYFYLFGLHRFTGSPWQGTTFPADLLGTVVPSLNQQFAPRSLAAIGSKFVSADLAENGTYLGIPLLVVLAGAAVRFRRCGVVIFALAMAVAAWVLSLGPRLVIDTHQTSFRLPFTVFPHVPILDAVIAARFALLVDLFVALALAVTVDRLAFVVVERKGRHARRPGAAAAAAPAPGWLAVGVLSVVALLPLVPRWPYESVPTGIPAFFSSPALQRIAPGSVALTYPYPVYPEDQAMLWQAASAMRFRLIGGYALTAGAMGAATSSAPPLVPPAVTATLTGDWLGVSQGPPPAPAQTRAFLQRYHVSTVLVYDGGSEPAAVLALFGAALGPPDVTGEITAWFGVQHSSA